MATGINLTDPRVDRAFRNALIAAGVVCLAWTVIVAMQTSAARAAVAAKNAQLEAKKNLRETQDIAFRAHRRAAKNIGDAPKPIPFQGTSAFAYATDTLARGAGATLVNVHFGDTASNNAQSPTFECDFAGRFPSLVKIIDGMAPPTSTTMITSTEISREKVDPHTGNAVVMMRVEGKLGQ